MVEVLAPRLGNSPRLRKPRAVVRKPGSADFNFLDSQHNSGTTKGQGIAINRNKEEKLPAKRVSFALEPSESIELTRKINYQSGD